MSRVPEANSLSRLSGGVREDRTHRGGSPPAGLQPAASPSMLPPHGAADGARTRAPALATLGASRYTTAAHSS